MSEAHKKALDILGGYVVTKRGATAVKVGNYSQS